MVAGALIGCDDRRAPRLAVVARLIQVDGPHLPRDVDVFARDEGKERDRDRRADESYGTVVAADREQGEGRPDRVLRAGAVDYRVDLGVAGGSLQLLAHVVARPASQVDDRVGTVVFRDRELLVVAAEIDDRRTGGE
jgi:hypothetical protein